MDTLDAQIVEILESQGGQYRTLRRVLLRQVACLRRDDVAGVGTATAEIREMMSQVGELEVRLTPLIKQWRERPAKTGDRIPELARAMCAVVAELQDLRAENEGLARVSMSRRRQEMVNLSVGAQAVRGYSPRPLEEARFVDRKR